MDFVFTQYLLFLVDESAFEGINLDDFDEDEVVYDNRGQISDDEWWKLTKYKATSTLDTLMNWCSVDPF